VEGERNRLAAIALIMLARPAVPDVGVVAKNATTVTVRERYHLAQEIEVAQARVFMRDLCVAVKIAVLTLGKDNGYIDARARMP
jgi:hypothetical protein